MTDSFQISGTTFVLDGDGIVDGIEAVNQLMAAMQSIAPVDNDNDGAADYLDTDSDNDTIPDVTKGHDANGDGQPDRTLLGQDGDGDELDDAYDTVTPATLTVENARGSNAPLPDHDGDLPDWRDADDDGDGIPTRDEVSGGPLDCDNNGTPDYLEAMPAQERIYLPIVIR